MKGNTKKQQIAFTKGMKKELIRLGAIDLGGIKKGNILDNVFELTTKGGLLYLRIDGEFMYNLFGRFYDTDKAKTLKLSNFNSFSGKWNHHINITDPNEAIQIIVDELETII